MVFLSYVLAAIAFGVLVTVHEFGHMWVAKKLGMYVPRFSVGFGPVIWSKQIGETEYALSAVPLGGYVRIGGLGGDDDFDANDPRHFANRPAWAKLLALAAGPFANYVLAFAIGVPLLLFPSKEPAPETTRITVMAGQPADVAGLKSGDDVRGIGKNMVHDFASIRTGINTLAKEHPGDPLPFAVVRDGQPMVVLVKPQQVGDAFIVGIAPGDKPVPAMSLPDAIPQAVRNIWTASGMSLAVVGKLLTREASVNQLSGPIGMITGTAEQAQKGLLEYVRTVWGLSIAIGFFNLLPIPALDGGRVVFRLYEMVARRRMNQRIEDVVHSVGIVVLLLLILFVSKGDTMRIVQKFMHG